MITITDSLTSARGFFGMQVMSSKKEPIPEKEREFTQVVTDTFFKTFHNTTGIIAGDSSQYGLFRYCKVGTGTVERGVEDVGLHIPMSTPVADANGVSTEGVSSGIETHGGKSYFRMTRKYYFNEGAIVGTIREVGLFSENNNTTLLAGQLIKDEFDVPTPITLLADEQLIVTYTIYIETPRTGAGHGFVNLGEIGSGSITIGGVNYGYVISYAQGAYMLDASLKVLINYSSITPSTNMQYVVINGAMYFNTLIAVSQYSATMYANRVEKNYAATIKPSFGTTVINSLALPNMPGGSSNYNTVHIAFTPGIPKSDLQTFDISFKHTSKWRSL